ncbi:unnamed protein product [Didymodactylos carnosus]|uniref:Uncharacterized protein n=1 Tax=Didymodactylos carnosus TaxID=1234261 RepID=A0A816CL10_9BILA|nr:unnamed protein product [Didymodactylos carnosus]CAF1623275.1 unnamed protein product [Didymodactylos carnosus]CAF3813760.1 unnamed protein product [Didymodactylos carnosus]CAF4515021.1 unnamed protein product [Didymodactylos carnosus]
MAPPALDISNTIAYTATVFGAVALILACIGIGTPNWQTTYSDSPSNRNISTTINFYYACSYVAGFPSVCYNRATHRQPPYSPNSNDYYQRQQNAAGLAIVGILFLAFGTIATLLMARDVFKANVKHLNFLPAALLFLATLFMLAALAEGSRTMMYNDYSANLYATGHLLTIISLLFSSFAGGRIHAVKMQEGA